MLLTLLTPFGALIIGTILFYILRAKPQETSDTPEAASLRKRLRLSGGGILLMGLVAACFVYNTTVPGPEDDWDVIGFRFEGGNAYPIRASESISYQRQVGKEGGWSVLSDIAIRWTSSRWRGRNLAWTLLELALLAFVALLFLAKCDLTRRN